MGPFALGVTAAFSAFVLQEWVKNEMQGYRIRKLLVANMTETIRGLRDHYPDLVKIEEYLTSGQPSFIWDSSTFSQTPDYVTNAIHSLFPTETTKCWKFYDALARLDAIRDQYNESVGNFIIKESESQFHKKIGIACIHDLRKNYKQAISVGSTLLLEMEQNHALIDIDVFQCKADIRDFNGEATADNKGG